MKGIVVLNAFLPISCINVKSYNLYRVCIKFCQFSNFYNFNYSVAFLFFFYKYICCTDSDSKTYEVISLFHVTKKKLLTTICTGLSVCFVLCLLVSFLLKKEEGLLTKTWLSDIILDGSAFVNEQIQETSILNTNWDNKLLRK